MGDLQHQAQLQAQLHAQHSAQDHADLARRAGASSLAQALVASRSDTLATFAALQRGLPLLKVPMLATLNPPLWELGHMGWFQEFWIARNPQRHLGAAADPHATRANPQRADADQLYDSSHVPHDSRWSLPLPDAESTRADLAQQLSTTLACLNNSAADDAALYFFRLALLHEDMHHEAALYMAHSLGVPIDDARWQATPLRDHTLPLQIAAGPHRLGHHGPGFAFDNELLAHTVVLPAFAIDHQVTRWADYLPFVPAFVQSGGTPPRYLRQQSGGLQGLQGWQRWQHGEWRPLDLHLPACHLTALEADAWCRWAGRRLPTEAEWECAATARPADFQWGQVWEWTASTFSPYAGFAAHPYRDYSAPWFGGQHRVLRGASFMTQPRMHDVRYRNFFLPTRNDVPAGFRSCAL
jgi:gamma-glutamyl hercynylcysteine S-oxide synthase